MASMKEFNPNANYEVLVGFRLYGIDYERGQVFDKKVCTTRLLRQLYENYHLQMTNKAPDQTFSEYLAGVNPLSLMTVEELTKFLTNRGITPRHNASRSQLLTRAEQAVLDAEKTEKAPPPTAPSEGARVRVRSRGTQDKGDDRQAPAARS